MDDVITLENLVQPEPDKRYLKLRSSQAQEDTFDHSLVTRGRWGLVTAVTGCAVAGIHLACADL